MNPNPPNQFAWMLGLAFLFWVPVAMLMISGSLDVVIGGMLFLGSLLVSWIGTSIFFGIVTGYRNTQLELERAKREIEYIERRARLEQDEQERRRKTDQE